MNTFSGSGPIPHRSWLIGAIAILPLAACATIGSTQAERPSDGDEVEIGYGTVDAEHEHGSAETVQSSGSTAIVFRTVAEMLLRIPGVRVFEQPGGRLSVRIRGTNSFLAGEEPLWVLDGMAITSGAGLAGINPNVIESITVLKDPGETAVFGARGANGVILIKTKRGG